MNRAAREISARTVVARPARPCGTASVRMRSRHAAETPKLTALNSSALAAPTASAARPAAPRPPIAATDALACSLALPSISSSARTRAGRKT